MSLQRPNAVWHAVFAATTTLCALGAAGSVQAQQGETVKIAWIDPLSGLMASVGSNQLKSFQYVSDYFNTQSKNNPAGVKFEVQGFDNKLSPQETASLVRSAIDQGFRYIVQGNGSGNSLAIMEALERHNARNPGKEVVFINHSGVDPEMTNEKCSYWHFRLDADTTMKMRALAQFIGQQGEVKKVYLINQNYGHGQQVTRYARQYLKEYAPDVQIVGEDFHPLAQVRDFAPYIAKIRASGADAVISGNWGSDLSLLVKAANDAGLKDVKFFVYYGTASGSPTAFGAAAEGKVYEVFYSHMNLPGEIGEITRGFKDKFKEDMYTTSVYNGLAMLSHAMHKAGSTDPLKVAAAMEGLEFPGAHGTLTMRKDDHQLQQGLFITRWSKASDAMPYSQENTGLAFQPVQHFEPAQASTPTTCQMKRPS
ncbi:branched-chain amino acid ABC transporter substrate-binding protein [Vandammella animalimorsus]|uniref:Branched-chain amino acid ABC transporter substrate-binding protein n=1 Tax=Vandammella animalimorsus TaxID=2029117 RepID=A0A2A2A5W8_9BURK|nr:branched-chain amino acid ABC transporter substrate-binding protein [Vandammella animalimorsus]PAT33885.1 branched-chain amino acid ABC transporter substrate-binding protein [Vandammella animalimorsus]